MLVKVTQNNVTKVAEEILEQTLDYLYQNEPNSDMVPVIEAELDRRDRISDDIKKKVFASKLQAMVELREMSDHVSHLMSRFRFGRMDLLISRLGSEFIDDYTIDEVNNTVISFVAQNSSFHQNNDRWVCETYEEATLKVRNLVYYRIYDRYVRDATRETLDYARRMLGE